jgi:translocation and assembly module TamB
LLLAVAALLVAAVASVNLPWVRERICRELSARISAPLAGRLEITQLDHVGWGSVRGVKALKHGPSGQRLAAISVIEAAIDLPRLVLSWLSSGPVLLRLEYCHVAELQLGFQRTQAGDLALLAALAPAAPRAAHGSEPSDSGALQLELAKIALQHARISALFAEDSAAFAELEDLHGRAAMNGGGWTATLEGVQVAGHGLPVVGEVTGALSGSLALRRDVRDTLAGLNASARWQGLVAGIPVQATLADDRGRLSGHLESRVSGDPLRRWLPEAAPNAAVTLQADVDGTTEQLAVRAALDSGAGEFHASARVGLAPELSLRVNGQVSRLDLSHWLASAPQSSLQFTFSATLEHSSGWTALQLGLQSDASSIAERPLPAIEASARLEDTPGSQQLALKIDGAGASLRSGLVRLLPAEQSAEFVGWLHASVQQLGPWSAVWGIDLPIAGAVTVDASAIVEPGERPAISGYASAEASDFSAGGASMRRSSLRLSAMGPLTRPVVDFFVLASQLDVQGYRLLRLRLSGRGGADDLWLRGVAQPRGAAAVRLSAHVRPAQRSASQVRLRAGTAGRPAFMSAQRVTIGSGFSVSGLRMRGPGSLSGDGSLQQGQLRLRARATGFSPARFLQRLGYDPRLPDGFADLSVRLDYRRGTYSGRIDGVARQVAWAGVKGLTLAVHIGARQRELDGQLALRAPTLGSVLLEARDLKLPERWSRASVMQMPGVLDLIAHGDLEAIARFAGGASLARFGARGMADARLRWASSGTAAPTLTMALSSRHLAWSLPENCAETRTGERCRDAAAFRWQGMDVRLALQSSGGQLRAAGTVVDSQGLPLLKLRANIPRDLAALLRAGESLEVRALPLEARIEVPERRLADFPESLRFEQLEGRLSASATLSGALGRPALQTRAQLLGLRLARSQESHLDARAELRLQGERMSLSAQVSRGSHVLLELMSRAALGGSSEQQRLRQLQRDVRSDGLPLAPFSALLGRDFSGLVYGSASVSSSAGAPELKGALRIEEPTFEGFRQQRARWMARADASSLSSELVLEQLAGRAQLTVSGPWRWDGSFTPKLAPEQLRASVQTQHFDLRAIEPFLPDAARGIGGQLDASVLLAPTSSARGDISGSLRWTEGSIYLAGLGQTFHDVTLEAQLDPSGRIVLEHLGARAALGRVEASGRAQLDGLRLRSAQLDLLIPERDPFPITLQGVTVATASGSARVEAQGGSSPEQGLLADLKLSIPSLRITLPAQAPPDVQELEADPTIHKGTYLEPSRFVTLPLPPYLPQGGERTAARPAPSPRVQVQIGDDVWVERGTTLKVKVAGNVSLELGGKTTISGRLQLPRGVIDVQSREFELERGELTFLEDQPPTNPTLIARAVYEAPDGIRVYAEFVGPVKTGHLTLRSEPPLRDDQILSLLLFGSPDGSFGASAGGSMTESALAAGGSVLTQGLNAELRRFTSLDIQTKIGERAGEPQPEVLVQVTPRLSAELAYLVETTASGQPPDRTQLTLDLRLFKNWSLSTTIGDAGSLLVDLLWRHRY